MSTTMPDYWETRTWDDRIAGLESFGFLPKEASPDAHEAERRSEYTRFRRRFLEVARDMAEAERVSDPYAPRAQDLIGKALDVAGSILIAFPGLGSDNDAKAKMNADDVRKALRLTYPAASGTEMVEMVRRGSKFDIDFGQLEAGVKVYLESEFRDPKIDRALLSILIDAKTTSLVMAFTERPTIGGKHVLFNHSLEKTANRTLLGLWLEGRFVDAIVAAVLAIPALVVAYLVGLPPSAGDVIILLALGIVCARGLWILMLFPRFSREQVKLREHVLWGISQMRKFYSEYHSTDDSFFVLPHPISVPRLRADVERLAAKEIVWPQSLWAMLDDIEARGLRRL